MIYSIIYFHFTNSQIKALLLVLNFGTDESVIISNLQNILLINIY